MLTWYLKVTEQNSIKTSGAVKKKSLIFSFDICGKIFKRFGQLKLILEIEKYFSSLKYCYNRILFNFDHTITRT